MCLLFVVFASSNQDNIRKVLASFKIKNEDLYVLRAGSVE